MRLLNKNNSIIKWNSNDWKQFLIGTFLGVITSFLGAALPFLVKQTETIFQKKDLSESQKINSMFIVVLIMICIGIFGIISAFFSKVFLSKLSAKKLAQIRKEMFNNILETSFMDLKEYDHGSLMTRLTTDIFNFSLYYNWLLTNVIPSFLRWFVFLIMVFLLNYLIGLALIFLSFILYFVSYLYSKKSINYYKQSLNDIDRLNTISKENILGARIIRSFNLKPRQIKRFSETNDQFKKNATIADTKAFLSWPFAISFVNASAIIIILISAQISWSGIDFVGTQIDIGTIYAIFSYSYLILWSVYDFVFLYVYEARSNISKKRIKEILDLKNNYWIDQGSNFNFGDLIFNNVSFKFNKNIDEFVLKKINLNIKKGAKVGLIGPTGSGKTTFLNLISKIYEPLDGEIILGNVNYKNINSISLLNNISFAFQKRYLFSTSIRENILLANNGLNDEQIHELLKIAQIDEFVNEKESGIDFAIEENGQNLSGGQQQRISIARALAKEAKIFIFDDCFSALDNVTEQKVLEGVIKKTKESTLIIASQRISTIKKLDLIIVFDKGIICGIGTHDELIKSNNYYKKIFEIQTKGEKYE